MIRQSEGSQLHIGDRVCIRDLEGSNGDVESIRVISKGCLVDEFDGLMDEVVVTVRTSDSLISRRGIDIQRVQL